MNKLIKILAVLIVALLLLGCAKPSNTNQYPAGQNGDIVKNTSTSAPTTPSQNPTNPAPSTPSQVSGNPIVVFETTKGTFKAEIYMDKAPISGANFISLVKSGFYNGLTFHRYVPGFVIQGGDPKGDGTGGSEKTIPLEVRADLKHVKGALGMARSQSPNSASSQFYVSLDDLPSLDMNYAVFGQVTQGFDIAEQLRQGDKMTKVYVQ